MKRTVVYLSTGPAVAELYFPGTVEMRVLLVARCRHVTVGMQAFELRPLLWSCCGTALLVCAMTWKKAAGDRITTPTNERLIPTGVRAADRAVLACCVLTSCA